MVVVTIILYTPCTCIYKTLNKCDNRFVPCNDPPLSSTVPRWDRACQMSVSRTEWARDRCARSWWASGFSSSRAAPWPARVLWLQAGRFAPVSLSRVAKARQRSACAHQRRTHSIPRHEPWCPDRSSDCVVFFSVLLCYLPCNLCYPACRRMCNG